MAEPDIGPEVDAAVDEAGLAAELLARAENEARLTRLATLFMRAEHSEFDAGVDAALAEIGSLDFVDRVSIWRLEDDHLHHSYEWTAPSVTGTKESDGPYPVTAGGRFIETLMALDEVRIPDVAELGEEWHEEARSLSERDVRSLLAVPMVEHGRFMGTVTFSSLRVAPIFESSHLSTLRAASGILAQAFARHTAEQRSEFHARFDSVTGLENRWAFNDAVNDALLRFAGDLSSGLAVLLIDLDRFQVVNDSLGHRVGDEVLVAVADRLRAQVASTERIARFGGDEIVFLLDGCRSEAEASGRAQELCDALREPFTIQGRAIFVTGSVGVALCDCDDVGIEADELVRRADAAMNAAKQHGGDRVEVFDEAVRQRVHSRIDREADLHQAVAGDQLVLHYQPEWDLTDGMAVAVEALVRWEHPELGLLSPAAFIPLAEETGMILEVGQWVLEAACGQLADWNRRGMHPTMRINLSAKQLGQPDLPARVLDVIHRFAVDPASVCLEITESALMSDARLSLEILGALHDQGIKLAIDDFGTGYSSLAYLKRFPVDVIKIDQSFVTGLGNDPDDTAIVRTIISMADALGLEVTAEGIETEQQLDELIALGCGRGQGFLLARPEAADAVVARFGRPFPRR